MRSVVQVNFRPGDKQDTIRKRRTLLDELWITCSSDVPVTKPQKDRSDFEFAH
jgi:hypothetical protein